MRFRFNSPTAVNEHPTMTHQTPRRYLVIGYMTYDLYDTLNRIYYFYQNGSINNRTWDVIQLAFEHLRFDNELHLEEMFLPEPHSVDLDRRVPINLWLAIHGVRAPLNMQPIDLTYSDDEEDLETIDLDFDADTAHFDDEMVAIMENAVARREHDDENPLFEEGYTTTPSPLGDWGDDDDESVTSSGAVDL